MIELAIVLFFNQLGRGTFVDVLSNFLSSIPFLAVFFFILAFLFLILAKKKGKFIFLGAVLVALIYFLINDQILKYGIFEHVFYRIRPYLAYPGLILPGNEHWHDSSFPSGHMAMAAAYAFYFSSFLRRAWVWLLAVLFVIIEAFTRLHNGMHYPTDLLVGGTLGLIYGLAAVLVVKKVFKHLNKGMRSVKI